MSCSYWWLDDLFCCVHCSRYSQCFAMGWTTPTIAPSREIRWPSVPYFLGQSRFITTCPDKHHSSPGTPICPIFWLDIPNLTPFAHLCSRMLTQRWRKISSDFSVYTKKLNENKSTQKTKSKLKSTCKFKNCSHVCVRIIVYNCRTQYSTEQFR